MDKYKEIASEKHRFTLFLERNEIWFKTVLSLAVTIAALGVSIASYSTAKYQAQLSASIAESQKQEKQPCFSVQNYYDKNQEQYIYRIINTGGQLRDNRVSVFPFLYINQDITDRTITSPIDKSDVGYHKYLNHAFIYLPSFYQNEPEFIFDDGIFAFSDIWLDIPTTFVSGNKGSYVFDDKIEDELADDYFRYLVSENNVDELSTRMNSEIVYYVNILYRNYENELHSETFWLGRSADSIYDVSGNIILSQHDDIETYYREAENNGYVFTVDSLNKSKEDIVKECTANIELLFNEFNQIRN